MTQVERTPKMGLYLAFAVVIVVLIGLGALVFRQGREVQQQEQSIASLGSGVIELKTALDQANEDLTDAGEPPVPTPDVEVPDVDDADPDDPEVQDPEIQQGEVQDPEIQDPENQEAENQEPEINDPEPGDAEVDDPDPNDPEIQDPEDQQPEIQDDETQDPEIDDPDPNSLLNFAVRNECQPGDNQDVGQYGFRWEQGGGVLTLVVTCTTRPEPLLGP